MNPKPSLKKVVQLVILCASAALGDALDEVLETLKVDPRVEWQVRVFDEAHAPPSEILANGPDLLTLLILDWRRCLSCGRSCHKSCPNVPLLLIGANPKSSDLPPQAASGLVVVLSAQPSPADLLLSFLHLAVCADVEGADESFARAALKGRTLQARLRDKWPCADGHDITHAADAAVLSHLRHPQCYNPRRGASVADFLCIMAERRLANLLRGEKRHAARFLSLDESVEGGRLEPTPARSPVELITTTGDASEQAAGLARRLEALEAFAKNHLPAGDQAVLRLMRRGEHDQAAYEEALGVAHLPEAERLGVVFRARNRIMERLKRWAGRQKATEGERGRGQPREPPEMSCADKHVAFGT
jgi:DNA-directed RNA polymerase specialized sigma24 family protein